jgi:ABC-type uncharacterized transport system substrate-binding protein
VRTSSPARSCALVIFILSLLTAPLAAEAQQAPRVYRLGILSTATAPGPPDPRTAVALVPAALRELGYIEGQNLVVERRYAGGKLELLPGMAHELVHLGVNVILAIALPAIHAAKGATGTIPIVFYGNFDPVATGLVTNLAHPGGNTTGVLIAPEGTLAAKKLELLKEAVPQATRIALLVPEDIEAQGLQVQEAQKAAAALRVRLTVVQARGHNYDRAFATIAAERPGALFGEMSLLDGGPRSATIVAETPVRLLVISRRNFSMLLKEVPGLTQSLLVTLSRRVRQAEERAERMGGALAGL